MQEFAQKQATRDAVRVSIANFLYDDRTVLPPSYEIGEIDLKAQAVYAHVLTRHGGNSYAA
jgi:type I restriction enzyme R subunit